jgi:hypothetical protein
LTTFVPPPPRLRDIVASRHRKKVEGSVASIASPPHKRPISNNFLTVTGPDAADQVVRLRDVAPRGSGAKLLLRVEASAVWYVAVAVFCFLVHWR